MKILLAICALLTPPKHGWALGCSETLWHGGARVRPSRCAAACMKLSSAALQGCSVSCPTNAEYHEWWLAHAGEDAGSEREMVRAVSRDSEELYLFHLKTLQCQKRHYRHMFRELTESGVCKNFCPLVFKT